MLLCIVMYKFLYEYIFIRGDTYLGVELLGNVAIVQDYFPK